MSQARPSAGSSSRGPHAAASVSLAHSRLRHLRSLILNLTQTSQSGSSGSGLYNRLHPPSSMPPEQYDPSNYGYSVSNAPRPSHHFARIPPQKVRFRRTKCTWETDLNIISEIRIMGPRGPPRERHPTVCRSSSTERFAAINVTKRIVRLR
jgi:hypothetical protein